MPVFEITGPDGRKFDITTPEGATLQDAIAYTQQTYYTPQPVQPPEKSGFLRQVADVPVSAAKGVATGVRLIADAFGADTEISQTIRGVEDYLGELMSAQAKNDQQTIAKIMKDAEDKGVLEQVKAGIKAFATAPVDLLTNALGTAAPVIAGTLASTVVGGPVGTGAAIVGLGGAMGAGTVKSSIYDATLQELKSAGIPEAEAKAAAVRAQEYSGDNLDQIAIGAALGVVASRFGIEPAAMNAITSRIAGRAAAQVGAKEAAKQGLLRAGAIEAVPEFAQAAQEQFAQNLALQRQGFDVPLSRGVVGAGTLEGLAGFGLGAGIEALGGAPETKPAPPPATPPVVGAPTLTAPETPADPAMMTYAERVNEILALEAEPQTPATKARVDALRAMNVQDDVQAIGTRTKKTPKDIESMSREERQREIYNLENLPADKKDAAVQGKLASLYALNAEPATLQEQMTYGTPAQMEMRGMIPGGVPETTVAPVEPEVEAPTAQPIATLTPEVLAATGLKKQSGFFKQLLNKDLTDRAQRQEVMDTLNKIRANRKVTQQTKDSLELIVGRMFAEFAKQGDMFGPRGGVLKEATYKPIKVAPEPTPTVTEEAAPETTISEATLKKLGIGPSNTSMRKVILGKDLTDPVDRQDVYKILDEFAANPKRSAPVIRRIEEFLSQPIFEGVQDVGTTGKPVTRGVEPSVPVSGEPTPAAPAAPTGVTGEPDLRGVGDVVEGAGPVVGGEVTQQSALDLIPEPTKRAKPEARTPGEKLMAKYAEEFNGDDARVAEQLGYDLYAGNKPVAVKDAIGKLSPEMQTRVAEHAKNLRLMEERGNINLERMNKQQQLEREIAKQFKENRSELEANDPSAEEAAIVSQGLEGKTVVEAARWLAQNAPDADQRLIAERVAERVSEMEKLGIKFSFNIVRAGDTVPKDLIPRLRRARGLTNSYIRGKDAGTIDVYLNGDNFGGGIGTSYQVALHELVHAATMGAIRIGNYRVSADTELNKAVGNLYKVSRAIIKHFNERASVPSQLTEFERNVYARNNNALNDVDEILTWALTNRDMQKYLETIPYKNTGVSMWSKIVSAVRDFLGLTPEADTALSEVLRVADEILSSSVPDLKGKADIVGESMMRTKAAPELTPAGERAKQLVDELSGVSNEKPKVVQRTTVEKASAFFTDPTYRQEQIDKFRVQVAYKGAAVERKLKLLDKYNGKLRDALGNIRPDVFMTAAEHSDTMAVAVMKRGRLRLDKNIGWVAEDGKASLQGVTDKIRKLGERLGDYQLAQKLYNDAAIARRANALKNKPELEIAALPDQAKIDAGLRAFKEFPELEEAFQEFTEFKNGLIDAGVEAGRFSKERAKEWKDAIDYVPWTRIKDFEETIQNSPKAYFKGLTNLGDMKHLKGGEDEINNIFDNMVGLSFWLTNSAIRNHAALKLVDAFVENNLGARRVYPGQSDVNPRQIVYIYRDGKPEVYEFDSMADVYAFKGIESVGGPLLRSFTEISNFLRKTTTATPQFAFSQLFQDAYRATVMSGVRSPFKVASKVIGGFWSAYKGDPTTRKLENMGIVGMYDLMPGRARQEIEEEFGIRQKTKFNRALEFMESFSIASDAALRKAVFDQTLEETKSAEFPDGDVLLARYRAQEIINFKRQGVNRTVGVMRQMIPFMNAYIQGMDVFYRTMIGEGVAAAERAEATRLFWVTGAKLATLSLLYSMMVGDDDEYKGLRDYDQNKHYILPGGVKIPVAPEVGLLFKVIPERVYNYISSQGTETPEDATNLKKALATAAFDALSGPNLTPQAIKPTLEVAVNYSFFTGAPIVGKGMENKEAQYQFTEYTSELAIMLGELTGLSPAKLEYLMRGYTGIAGGTLLDVTNMLASDRPEKRIYEMPGFKTFMYDKIPGGYKEDYYDLRNRVAKVVGTVNDLGKTARMEELDIYFTDEKAKLYALKSVMSKIDQELEDFRAYKKLVLEDPNMDSESKKNALDEIETMENELLQSYNIPALRVEAGL